MQDTTSQWGKEYDEFVQMVREGLDAADGPDELLSLGRMIVAVMREDD